MGVQQSKILRDYIVEYDEEVKQIVLSEHPHTNPDDIPNHSKMLSMWDRINNDSLQVYQYRDYQLFGWYLASLTGLNARLMKSSFINIFEKVKKIHTNRDFILIHHTQYIAQLKSWFEELLLDFGKDNNTNSAEFDRILNYTKIFTDNNSKDFKQQREVELREIQAAIRHAKNNPNCAFYQVKHPSYDTSIQGFPRPRQALVPTAFLVKGQLNADGDDELEKVLHHHKSPKKIAEICVKLFTSNIVEKYHNNGIKFGSSEPGIIGERLHTLFWSWCMEIYVEIYQELSKLNPPLIIGTTLIVENNRHCRSVFANTFTAPQTGKGGSAEPLSRSTISQADRNPPSLSRNNSTTADGNPSLSRNKSTRGESLPALSRNNSRVENNLSSSRSALKSLIARNSPNHSDHCDHTTLSSISSSFNPQTYNYPNNHEQRNAFLFLEPVDHYQRLAAMRTSSIKWSEWPEEFDSDYQKAPWFTLMSPQWMARALERRYSQQIVYDVVMDMVCRGMYAWIGEHIIHHIEKCVDFIHNTVHSIQDRLDSPPYQDEIISDYELKQALAEVTCDDRIKGSGEIDDVF